MVRVTLCEQAVINTYYNNYTLTLKDFKRLQVTISCVGGTYPLTSYRHYIHRYMTKIVLLRFLLLLWQREYFIKHYKGSGLKIKSREVDLKFGIFRAWLGQLHIIKCNNVDSDDLQYDNIFIFI